MKKIIRVISTCLIIFLIFNMMASFVYADWWGDANSWYQGDEFGDAIKPSTITSSVPDKAKEVIEAFEDMVNVVGTTVIVLVTIFLGIKYMFGSFEAKADVKESLINLLVACVFFFGWNSIWGILFPNGELVFVEKTTNYESVVANIFATLTNIANFLAIGAVIYIGVRYIFSGAQGKAELKGKSGQFILGIILAFCSVGFLNYISDLVKAIFG